MKKTLGGDRLGSGSKMQVELHNYSRSTHDIGYLFRTTMSAGTLVPFLYEIGLPGDTFDIDLNTDIKTHPTVGPLFGSYKVQLDVFQAPIRLYQAQLHNNKLKIGMKMSDVKLPYIAFKVPKLTADELAGLADIDNSQVNPSSIISYLGIRGFGIANVPSIQEYRTFHGLGLLTYWDTYKQYYSNKQEGIGAVIHSEPITYVNNVDDIQIPSGGISLDQYPSITSPPILLTLGTTFKVVKTIDVPNTGEVVQIRMNGGIVRRLVDIATLTSEDANAQVWTYKWSVYGDDTARNWQYLDQNDVVNKEISITTFPLSNIDDMREAILLTANAGTTPFSVFGAGLEPYTLLEVENGDGFRSIMESQEGLALKTYQSDLFNNWLDTEWIDGTGGISEITAISTVAGSFTIDTLNLSKKVYDMLNRIAVSGGTYDDWIDAVYTHDRYTRCESPMYCGGLIKELVFQEVVSNAEAGPVDGAQPLGTLAGRGILGKKHKGGQVTIKVDEPSIIMGLVSITPRIDYSQGNEWHTHLNDMDDLHKPALDEIGFQELITEQMAWWDTWQHTDGTWRTRSAGKQPAWINYMTNTNKIKGNFAIESNEMFMVLTRKYKAAPDPLDGDILKIEDLTTYVDPRKYNHIFAETSLDSQNFWCQIGVDMNVRRKISARLMPNL